MNQIIGYGEMLEEDAVDRNLAEIIPDLQKIQTAARNLLRLIESHFGDPLRSAFETLNRPLSHSSSESPQTVSVTNPTVTSDRNLSRNIQGRVLVADDQEHNRDLLKRRLERQGHVIQTVENGVQALEALQSENFDLILLDVMMPELDGYHTLLAIKQDPKLQHLPVIMISAIDELETVVRCIETGAEDYLPKPFNPTLLAARISACLEKKAMRDAEKIYLARIEQTQIRLTQELQDAATYVQSLFPEPIESENGISIDWLSQPCSELGGDAFGYHWIDPDHFAIYLLDVSGHGVRPCLLAATVTNLIRSGNVAGNDPRNPATVLGCLNDLFPMEQQNDLFFTIWYGVYCHSSRTLTYASGGHPDGLLLSDLGNNAAGCQRLSATGIAMGAFPNETFENVSVNIPNPSELIIFSDGCFEVKTRNQKMLTMTSIQDYFCTRESGDRTPEGWLEEIKTQRDSPNLDDDFTMVRIRFSQP